MANTTLLDPKQLGSWIKCVREGQKWSQEALGAAAGVDPAQELHGGLGIGAARVRVADLRGKI